MKRAFCLFFVLILCLFLVACGGDTAGSQTDADASGDGEHVCVGGEWKVVSQATCAKEGERWQMCSCGLVVATEAIPLKDHTFAEGVCVTCGAEDPNYKPDPSKGLEFESFGNGTCQVTGLGTCQATDIVIPTESPAGDRVTTVGEGAFRDCTHLTGVTLSTGVRIVDNYAFSGCTSLASVKLPGTLAYIGWGSFKGCTALTEIVIPDSVEIIGYSAFSECTALKSVQMGSGVESIGKSAFADCASLTEIVIPAAVTELGSGAFDGCIGLTKVTIETTTVLFNVFYGLPSVTEVTVPGEAANDYINYGSSLLWGDWMSSGVLELPAPTKPETPTEYLEFTPIGIGSGKCYVSGIGQCYDALILIPETSPDGDTVVGIGYEAFVDCTNIVAVFIPDTVTSIGDRAFVGCTSLTTVGLPGALETLGGSVFRNCSSLQSVDFPASITSVGDSLLEGCESLTEVTIRNMAGSISYLDMPFLGLVQELVLYAPATLEAIYVPQGEKPMYENNISLLADRHGVMENLNLIQEMSE